MGEVAHEAFDGTFLWSDVLLRGPLRAAAVRHHTLRTDRKPNGDDGRRTDNGGLPVRPPFLGGLSDGGRHRGSKMPELRPRPRGMGNTGGRYGALNPKLRRGRDIAGQDNGNRRNGYGSEITK